MTTYIVKSGDTLSGIAAKYNVSGGYQKLASYNGISNPNNISVGQKINIPGTDNTSSGATSSSHSSSTTSSSSSSETVYTVRSGDSLSAIASRFNVSGGYKALASYNGISNPNIISVGQKIRIPGSAGSSSSTTTSTPAPTTSNTTNNSSSTTNSSSTSSNSGSTQTTQSSEIVYTVKSGDSLSAIASRYGVVGGYQRLASYNGIANPNNISVGQKIRIPSGSESAPSTSQPGNSNVSAGGGSAYPITQDQLSKVASGANKYYSQLVNAMSVANINTRQRACCFVAQLAHESGNFIYMREIASGAEYEGRSDLGNVYPGDGVRYAGRGPIQITGRYNYTKASEALGIDFVGNPELAEDPYYGFMLSAWYWNYCSLNSYCDSYDFVGLTRAINGGTNGLDDRRRYYNLANTYF